MSDCKTQGFLKLILLPEPHLPIQDKDGNVHSFVSTLLLVLLGLVAAFVAGFVIDKNFFTLLLSYCPGGIYEVAVIAIFFDLDPEFVSFHHIIRLLMILFVVPVILKLVYKNKKPA